jgi:calcineurin-like phosphoesterase family protein
MPTIYFTSNQQFGRPSAIRDFARPFENVEEMNQSLIASWNSTVKLDDIVYVLGNFAWDPTTAEDVIKKLNGTIIFVQGEHDNAIVDLTKRKVMPHHAALIEPLFSSSTDKISLSYWPLHEWPGKSKGYYHFFGYPNKKYKTDHKKRMVNVSCDFWSYKPKSLDSIMDLFNDIES